MLVCYPPGADWSCAYDAGEFAGLDPVNVEIAEASAWLALTSLTGGQIAFRPVTVRPCRAGCQPPGTWMVAPVLSSGSFAGVRPGIYSGFAPYVSASGAWVNSCGCGAPADCGCSMLSEVILPAPVGEIVEVWLDGAVLDADAYRVDNGNRLVRTDGGIWPACQNLAEDAHGDTAFSVTYYRGAAPDNLILRAVGLLAVEFYKGCTGQECALPSNAISVSRQGISMEIQAGLFPGGKTNLPVVDNLIQTYNPFGLVVAPVIASPDTIRRQPRATTWGT